MYDQMPIEVFIPLASILWLTVLVMVLRARRRRIRKGNKQ